MSVAITIQLPPQSVALIQKYKGASTQVPQAIQRGMNRSLAIVAGRIQVRRLTGIGPFPVVEHRLGERSGQLKLRTRSTPAQINGNEITGAIGSSVKYAAFQEFGTKTLPERAPFRTGIKENLEYVTSEIAKEVEATLKK